MQILKDTIPEKLSGIYHFTDGSLASMEVELCSASLQKFTCSLHVDQQRILTSTDVMIHRCQNLNKDTTQMSSRESSSRRLWPQSSYSSASYCFTLEGKELMISCFALLWMYNRLLVYFHSFFSLFYTFYSHLLSESTSLLFSVSEVPQWPQRWAKDDIVDYTASK